MRYASYAAAAVLLASLYLPASALAARTPKPALCPGGRFVQATALVDPAALTGAEGIVIADKRITIDSGCASARVKLKRLRTGTKVTAKWKTCGALKRVRLKGMIASDCTQLAGTLRAKKREPVAIAAALTRCGDALVDTARGETCDDGNTTGGDACSPTCGAPTTTTTLFGGDIVRLETSSPANGEGGVAVERETVLRFSGPLDPASVTAAAIHAEFAGQPRDARLHVSPDHRTVTLFYQGPLPGSARVRVLVDGGRLRDPGGRGVDADRNGSPGGTARIDFETLTLTLVEGTSVCGRVFASQLASTPGGASVNEPLAGVTITLDGTEGAISAVTDEFGDFRLEPVPAGRFFVTIDGHTADNGVPAGTFYPSVGKAWDSVAGREVNIGNVYLPLIADGTLQPVSPTEETVITFPPDVLEDHPELEGVVITVPPDALYGDDGTRGGRVGIAPVPPDRMPGPPPLGLEFPLVITVQTDGAEESNFDVPVAICFPNLPLPETGQPLPPGAESALWSFSHDTGRWEMQGPMHVTADGLLVCTDPGVGIRAPGWHGSRPGGSASGGPITSGPPRPDHPDDPKGPQSCPRATPSGDPCPKCEGATCGKNGTDPIHLHSGEFYEDEVDLRIKGRGMDFLWARTYRSQLGSNTAQGNGWDFSYNVALEKNGADLIQRDGNGRVDRYGAQPDGSWMRREFFSTLQCASAGAECGFFCENPAGGAPFPLRQVMPDGGYWEFNPFDGGAAEGKLRRSVDRNGNAMSFAYDAQGRLTGILDTLDRAITVAYNAGGFIESVTDFTGRRVRYTYYASGESGGSPGDLKTVTTPAVTGTPTGNDFPSGKTTTYTYSTGFADQRLNHNLLTATDPKGQTYLRNTYGSATDPTNVTFDRVVRQVWGNPTDTIDLTYVPQVPSAANGQAIRKTIVRDRVGNVQEIFWDAGNRNVLMREYTGRADPTQPTTDVLNRPTGQLRSTDPPFFEIRSVWNDDSLLVRQTLPNGNLLELVYEQDLSPSAPQSHRGNVRVRRRLPGTHTLPGDQAQLEQRFEYDPRFGGGEFVTRATDARGNDTLFTYDARGNRARVTQRIPAIVNDFERNAFGQLTAHVLPANGSGHRRRDEYTYHAAGPQRGYLSGKIVDAGGFALTSGYEYDAVGNLIRLIDPRGHDRRYVVNQRDQVIRKILSEVTDGSGVRYQHDAYFDANDNLVQVDVQNVDEAGAVGANTHFTTTTEYEILNRPIRVHQEVDPNRTIVTEAVYDANRNRILERSGEAVAGRQPTNVVQTLYDERNLPFRVIRAPGDPAQSTSQIDYDPNRNAVRVTGGTEDAAGGRVLVTEYDGYDRVVRVTDPMGNVSRTTYDPNGNPVASVTEGELTDAVGSAGNVRLSAGTATFDAMDRVTRTDAAFFDPATQANVADGQSTTLVEWADDSQVMRATNDNGHAVTTTFDTVNRVDTTTDAAGNTRRYAYDANSNVTTVTEVERSDLSGPDETFASSMTYDNLDRTSQVVDSAGNTSRMAYDSRHNPVVSRDANGNVVRITFDGLNRPADVSRELTDTGHGTGTVVGTIGTTATYDDNSRLLTLADDLGNTTSYAYDPLDRTIAAAMADGTQDGQTYDVHGNVVTSTDANGTVETSSYDRNDRLAQIDVIPGAGISSETTVRTFAYDGKSRLVGAIDDDTAVTLRYDSLDNVLAETLDGQETRYTYDGVGDALELTYPGGRVITRTYDVLERVKQITEGATLVAAYDYIGPGRIARRTLGNGSTAALAYDTARRITRTTHARADTSLLDDRSYTWDPVHRKTQVTDEVRGDATAIARDSIYRVEQTVRTPATGPAQTATYAIDGAQNWTAVTGGPAAGIYTRDATTPAPADRQTNQYTTTGFDARTYDPNGNLSQVDPSGPVARALGYNATDEMISYAAPGTTATYRYDALGRRVGKTVGGVETRFFFDGAQEIEEQTGAGVTEATYVFGSYVDEPLMMQRGATTTYYHGDDLYSVTALTDAAGALVETYEYDDYGLVTIRAPGGATRATSAVANPYLFTGRRYDPESGLYYYRTRYLDPRAGRFTTRDSIGTWGDPSNLGNAYAYVANDPFSTVDPMGLGEVWDVFAAGVYHDTFGQFESVDWQMMAEGASVQTVSGFVNAMDYVTPDSVYKWDKGDDPRLAQANAYNKCIANCYSKRSTEALSFGLLSASGEGIGAGPLANLVFGGEGDTGLPNMTGVPPLATAAAGEIGRRGLQAEVDAYNAAYLRTQAALEQSIGRHVGASGPLSEARGALNAYNRLAGELNQVFANLAANPVTGQVAKLIGEEIAGMKAGLQALHPAAVEANRVLPGLQAAYDKTVGPMREAFLRREQQFMRGQTLKQRAKALSKRLGGLHAVGKAFGGAMYAFDLGKCIDDCMKDPCPD